MNMYYQLFTAAMVPAALSAIFYLLIKFTGFKKLNYWTQQIIIGLFFGAAAILGTEWGIDVGGATANARDAAPLCAGLLFGGPAGIIAGVIGGVERWFAVAWGAGMYSRLACAVSTCLSGLYAAFLRKTIFEKKHPHWMMGLITGMVMEVIHLTILFLTHVSDPLNAYKIVTIVAGPMIIINGIGVMVAIWLINIIDGEYNIFKRGSNRKIASSIQVGMLITICVGLVAGIYATGKIQREFTKSDCITTMHTAIEDVKNSINKASDDNLLDKTKKITLYINANTTIADLNYLADEYNVSEISVVDKEGIITMSNNLDFIGYDMKSGAQSDEFNVLLGSTNSFVQSYQPISYDASVSMKYAGYKSIGGGYVQVGYDATHFENDLATFIQGATEDRHIGQEGFITICNSKFKIVSDPNGKEGSKISVLGFDFSQDLPEDTLLEATILGKPHSYMYVTAEGYYIIAAVPNDQIYQGTEMNTFLNSFMEILLFGLMFILIYIMIKRIVVDRIYEVNNSLDKISGGNLDEVVTVHSSEEFSELSSDINATVDKLKEYIAEAAARIDKELEMAKNIQSSALPNSAGAFPTRKDFEVSAYMCTAKEVGGDFYDFYLTHRNIINLLIADVSGKGVPAAMFMMRGKAQLKSLTEMDEPINEVFTKGNNALCEGNDAGMFITAWQGKVNLDTGLIEFANAGHNPPLVKHADGSFEYLKSRVAMVLAGMEGVNYKKQELQLQPGDILFLYTDGVTEATDANNELYGEDRLQAILNSKEFETMDELCATVKADVDKFVGEAPQFDDITMLAFKFKGQPPKPTYHSDHAQISDIPELTAFVESELEKMDCPMKAQVQIDIAIDELYSNIANYAYEGKPEPGPATVIVDKADEYNGVRITFIDDGIPYNPLKKEDPDVTLTAEQRGIGGLGIYMVKNSMDDMFYEFRNNMNYLTIQKKF